MALTEHLTFIIQTFPFHFIIHKVFMWPFAVNPTLTGGCYWLTSVPFRLTVDKRWP